MGAVDLVIQVESPGAVSRGLQRIGRAGHTAGRAQPGQGLPQAPSRPARGGRRRAAHGRRADRVDPLPPQPARRAGPAARGRGGPRRPQGRRAAALVRRAAPFAELSDDVFEAVLDLLSGRYPSEEFAELRPRVVWDRVEGVVRGRAGAQRLAVTNAGTIPDRGLFGVFLPDGKRVGELDEEMVYESRVGRDLPAGGHDLAHRARSPTTGSSSPRRRASPARCRSGTATGPGARSSWAGRWARSSASCGRSPTRRSATLRDVHGLDERAAANLVAYLDEQADATGAVPDDRTIVVERFRDEIGDWRVCILSPFGAPVHAPWGMALKHRLAETWGTDVEMIWSDDGIVLRLPDAVDDQPRRGLVGRRRPAGPPGGGAVASALPTAAPGARPWPPTPRCARRSRSRPTRSTTWSWPSCPTPRCSPAASARRRPVPCCCPGGGPTSARRCGSSASGRPTCWRWPAATPASRSCSRPPASASTTCSTCRRCARCWATSGRGKVRVVEVETEHASPFAQSLLFGWIAVYMYEGDAPLAERRAAALALDRDLLNDLLGADELRELLDAGALADLELELQCLVEGRRARDPDEAHDLLRRLGPLSPDELAARSEVPSDGEPGAGIAEARRGGGPSSWWPSGARSAATVAGAERLCAAEDAGRLRDALGVAIPVGLPERLHRVGRGAAGRAWWPATPAPTARSPPPRPPPATARPRPAWPRPSAALEADGRVVQGEFRPDGVEREWCDVDVLRQLRRRSLARLRDEVEPVDGATLARFLAAVARRRQRAAAGIDALADVIAQLQGAPIPASVLESRGAAGPPGRLPPRRPRRPVHRRRAGVGRRRVGGGQRRPGAPGVPRPGGAAGAVGRRGRRAARRARPPGAPRRPRAPGRLVLGRPRAGRAAGRPALRRRRPCSPPCGTWCGPAWSPTTRWRRCGPSWAARCARRPGARRPAVGRLARLGPPAGAGRWSLVGPLLDPRPSPTELAHARAAQLVERYGVLTREAALGEGTEGGFAGVYPVLRALEEKGRVRRGYFVAGLGAAQFALPGAVDRLRSRRVAADRESPTRPPVPGDLGGLTRRATRRRSWRMRRHRPGPALRGGAAVARDRRAPGPGRRGAGRAGRRRARGLRRAGRALAVDLPRRRRLPPAGRRRSASGWRRATCASHEVTTVDGEPVRTTPWADALRAAGFADGYRGLVARGPAAHDGRPPTRATRRGQMMLTERTPRPVWCEPWYPHQHVHRTVIGRRSSRCR